MKTQNGEQVVELSIEVNSVVLGHDPELPPPGLLVGFESRVMAKLASGAELAHRHTFTCGSEDAAYRQAERFMGKIVQSGRDLDDTCWVVRLDQGILSQWEQDDLALQMEQEVALRWPAAEWM